MLLIECNNINKMYGDRLIVDIEQLKIYSEDRIGVVGRNGAGKTTLINILSKRLDPDKGWVKVYGKTQYVSQLESPNSGKISCESASKFNVDYIYKENMSGGEKTKFKLASALESNGMILFADEPTSNIDIEGIELIEDKLSKYRGTLILVSHDRIFLNRLCNKILEIENGKVKLYKGNYDDYREQKTKEKERMNFEYEEYLREKKRLIGIINSTKGKAEKIKGPPKRMGASEARLHKMGGQKAKAGLERAVKNIEKRIEHLPIKERPKAQSGIKLDILDFDKLNAKVIIEGKSIIKAFGDKIIFKNADFSIYNNTRTALIGPNGCGKTTLMKLIMDKDTSISLAKGVKIGYFSQDMSILSENLSIIENVMERSIYPESLARLLLARLLFKGDSIYKQVNILSGGERVKISFAKILLEDINLLLLDEPTNYLDIDALEVIEESLKEYDRTLIFASHDRKFIDAVANNILIIKDYSIKSFKGAYSEYLYYKDKEQKGMDENEEKILILKNRLTEVLGRLSATAKTDDRAALDKEYHFIINELKKYES